MRVLKIKFENKSFKNYLKIGVLKTEVLKIKFEIWGAFFNIKKKV